MKRRRVRPSSQQMNMKKVRGKTTITEKMFMVQCCCLIILLLLLFIDVAL